MKKSLYVCIFYCLFRFSDTICATQNNGDQEEELLYTIEFFKKDTSEEKNEKSKPNSKDTNQSFSLIVSNKTPWINFKNIIREKYVYKAKKTDQDEKTGMEIEDRLSMPVYSRVGTPTSGKKTISSDEYKNTFFTLLKGKRPYSREAYFFEENDFKKLKEHSSYKFAKIIFGKQLAKLEESDKINQSVLAWKGGDEFELMGIDQYHEFKKSCALSKKNPTHTISLSESSPEPNEDLIDSNEDPLELSSEEDIPQLIQDKPVNESSLSLDSQNILVLPVVAGGFWVGHNQFFSEIKTEKKKKKKKKTAEDDKDPDEIIIEY